MQSRNLRYGPLSTALKWLIAIFGVVVIIIALVLSAVPSFDARAEVQPTPCPDSIACHALKRMPAQNGAVPVAP